MFSGGNLIVTVADLDAATRFYTERLGLRLTHRFGTRWVTVDAGPSYWGTDESGAGLVLGFQPRSTDDPAPGTAGAVSFGFETGDSVESLMSKFAGRGVRFTSEVITFEGGTCVALEDAEGNPSYLWEMSEDTLLEADRTAKELRGDAAPSIAGGHAVVFVSNMDRAVQYYSEALGLPLTYRYGDKIAFVEAGRKLVVALHPTSPKYPAPGTRGATRLALHVNEPIAQVVSQLAARGVRISGSRGADGREQGATLIEDLDGNWIELVEEGALTQKEAEAATMAGKS